MRLGVDISARILTTDVNGSILRAFDRYQGKDWEEIKAKCFGGVNAKESGILIQELQAMVEFCDIIDFYLYHNAIEKIFPKHYYNSDIKSDEEPRISNAWFNFFITRKAQYQATKGKDFGKCIIRINVSGSRKMTSAVDISMVISLERNVGTLLEHAYANIKDDSKRGKDFFGRIRNAVINRFYSLNEKEFNGMTSGEHYRKQSPGVKK